MRSGATRTTFKFSSRAGIRIESVRGMLSGGSHVSNTTARLDDAGDCGHPQQEESGPRQVARETDQPHDRHRHHASG